MCPDNISNTIIDSNKAINLNFLNFTSFSVSLKIYSSFSYIMTVVFIGFANKRRRKKKCYKILIIVNTPVDNYCYTKGRNAAVLIK